MEKAMERWKEEDAARIKVDCIKPVPVSKSTTAPVFNHPEINVLYRYGLAIPHEKLREILTLSRETVIADLEKILQDAVDRYQHFVQSDLKEESGSFLLHAIYLLSELKSENSLPAILNFLENNEEVLEFWLGDHITATIWLPLYLLSQSQLDLLKQFLLKPGIGTYSKNAVSKALAQIAIHDPQKRNEIATIYEEALTRYLSAELKDNLIDSDFLGLAIGNIIDCGFTELLPLIKKLFDKRFVSKNIFGLYGTVLSTWSGYSKDGGYDNYEDDRIPQPAVSNKIGRNDPCPCGSGKKYKKCCMNKLAS